MGACIAIRIHLKYDEDMMGDDMLALTKTQMNKMEKAHENKGKGATIVMNKAQMVYNMKVEGGFLAGLGALAAKFLPIIAKTVLPALGIGALTGLASSGVQKAVGKGMGEGLYLKRGGCVCRVEQMGKGLYLGPMSGRGHAKMGEGLYLKRGGEIIRGAGLLDILKNIPILGSLLGALF